MNELTEIIQGINTRLSRNLPGVALQLNGLARTIYDQSEARPVLVLQDSQPGDRDKKRVVADDSFEGQVCHRWDRLDITDSQQYGTSTQNYGELRFQLLGMGRIDFVNKAYAALASEPYVRVEGINADAYAVLTGEFRLPIGQEMNVSPDLFAFSIQYSICQIAVSDFLLSL